jgi:hypothetical protein
MKLNFIFGAYLSFLCLGCASTDKYHWGNYEKSLLNYYKDPTQLAQFEAELLKVIQSSEKKGKQVPPGIYAELGFIFLQRNQSQQATEFFHQESSRWPESKFFMDSMIQTASQSEPKKSGP